MNEEGYITMVGRIKDLVIRGGENIYPTEIEQFLYKHPKIEDVQVIHKVFHNSQGTKSHKGFENQPKGNFNALLCMIL